MFSYTLTNRQKEILDFLGDHHRSTGLVASVREIQKHFKFASSNAVASHLRALEQKGYLTRSKGKARSLTFPPAMAAVPNGSFSSRKAFIVEDEGTQLTLDPLVKDSDLPSPTNNNRSVGEPAPELDRMTSGFECRRLDTRTRLICGEALEVLGRIPVASVHSIVTDPPYGLIEYDAANHSKLRDGRGGVWRIPPKLDGVERAPLPRFTVLTEKDRKRLADFFRQFGEAALRILVPGGHLIIASNPLLSTQTFNSLLETGFEKRGEVIRLVTTLRGGDRPKGAEEEFSQVSVMPRSCWEPWGLFRKPLAERTVAENLRKWSTGGLRRLSSEEPFKDLVECPPARGAEREAAPHPSLKPQRLMRYLVRSCLPLERGIVLDPFAGSGSTLAAASALGFNSVGVERDGQYFNMAASAFLRLKSLRV